MWTKLWAVGGHLSGPTCGHTIGQLQWYMLPMGNIQARGDTFFFYINGVQDQFIHLSLFHYFLLMFGP